jgi:hypothetical protein
MVPLREHDLVAFTALPDLPYLNYPRLGKVTAWPFIPDTQSTTC